MKSYQTETIRFMEYAELDEQLNKIPDTWDIVMFREQWDGGVYKAIITFKVLD